MIKTRNIAELDSHDIVDIHIEAFSDFFLTSLGKSFLRVYYESLIKHKDGVAICAVNELSEIVGFCVGTTNSDGFHKRLIISNLFQFGIQFLVLLIKKPGSLVRLFTNMEKVPLKKTEGMVAELLSIGVRKSAAGTGVGSALVKQFEAELIKRKSSIVTLTTDFYNNEKVINFYRNIGFEIHGYFITYPDRKMYKMIKYI
jgi:ribosomal protein S18 acetylase RimI-like enzyme